MKLGEALAQARTQGIDRLDAELLAADVLRVARSAVIARPERILTATECERLLALYARRADGEPFAWLVGRQAFHDIELEMCPGVLVPRSDSEVLVDAALHETRTLEAEPCAILDLGCGSGAIGLAIAAARPRWHLTAVDIDRTACELTRRNAERLGITDRVEVIEGDWYAQLGERSWHLVTANPPYIARDDAEIAEDVRRYEPPRALFSGADGLEDIERIIFGAILVPDGLLVVEHGHRQGEAVRTLLRRAGLSDVRTERDLAQRERASLGRRTNDA